MLRGNWRGQRWAAAATLEVLGRARAGSLDDRAWSEIEDGIARSLGHCMTMGTASTMTSAAEALGMTLPGARLDPGRRLAPRAHGAPTAAGAIVEMVWEDLKPSRHC